MTRTHLFLIVAMIVVAGATPRVAQASCIGNACSALSAVATWSASDKRVNAVLTNKDQAKGMQLKFCITVEGKCNSFELTLPPHGNATKSVSLSGAAAPAKYGVDVSSADFTVAQGASQAPASQAPASQATTAANGIDVPRFGRFTYATAAESVVAPLLKKAISSLAAAEDLDLELLQQDNKLSSITQKLESVKNIEADVRENNKKSKGATIAARTSETAFETVLTMLDYMQKEAKGAADGLVISKVDLQAATDKKRADSLMAEAEKSRKGMLQFVSTISFAMDAAKKVATGPEGQADVAFSLAFEAANKVIDEFGASPWVEEANKLYAEAATLQADSVMQKLKLAGDHLKSTQETVGRLRPILQKAKANNDEAWQAVKQTYDDSTKGRFQWQTLDAAIPDAQKTIELARKTTEAAYGARDAARALERTGSGSNWPTPGDNQKIIIQMVDKASGIFDRAIKKRQIVELLLTKLQEASAKAKGAL